MHERLHVFNLCFQTLDPESSLDCSSSGFIDVFNKSEHTQVPLSNHSAFFMEGIHVSAEGVTNVLKCLYPLKTLGLDELHFRVLKDLTTELGPVFAHLFQQSIDTGEIPKEWSLTNVCPLYK